MSYVFDFKDAIAYEKWYTWPDNKFISDLEIRLMLNILKPDKGRTVLDIGCGTGMAMLKFVDLGLQTTGLDPSPYMLDIALKNVKNQADLHRGFAESLPFGDNSFNYACLSTTLEFVENPRKALEEAFRVAKDKVFIGVLNRYALKGIQRRIKGIFIDSIYNHARFFSIWELKQIIRSILGDVPVSWGTVYRFPFSGRIASTLERNRISQKYPFGQFVGMVVIPVPRFKTIPLTITCPAKYTTITSPG